MSIVTPDTMLDKLMEIKRHGKPRRGMSTGFESVDQYMLLNKKYLFLLTGYPSYGKSEYLDMLAVNTSIMHSWRWLFFSPESDNYSTHLNKLVCKKMGKPLVSATDAEIKAAVDWAHDHFAWIDSGEAMYSLDHVMKETEAYIAAGNTLDVMVIDPWNELSHTQSTRDDQYISDMMLKLRKFHRKHNILSVIVIHPHSVEKNKDGSYPIPHLRNCAGGAMWWNKSDYGVCVHRKDFTVQGAHIYIQKVKDTTIGYQGETFLDYQVGSGRFKDQHATSFDLPPAPEEYPF